MSTCLIICIPQRQNARRTYTAVLLKALNWNGVVRCWIAICLRTFKLEVTHATVSSGIISHVFARDNNSYSKLFGFEHRRMLKLHTFYFQCLTCCWHTVCPRYKYALKERIYVHNSNSAHSQSSLCHFFPFYDVSNVLLKMRTACRPVRLPL